MPLPTDTKCRPIHGLIIVGVDPGPMPGIGVIIEDRLAPRETKYFLCDAESLMGLVSNLFRAYPQYGRILACERFVVGARSSKLGNPQAAQKVRDQVGALESFAASQQIIFRSRSASEVKPWASPARLAKAGFLLPKGCPTHVLDGIRHCVFAATADGKLPDPLSSRATTSSASRQSSSQV